MTNGIAPLLARWISHALAAAAPGHVPLLCLSGPQGAGKSTALAEALSALSVPVAGFSLDDVYLTRAERTRLAADISPLFAVRGPPGTHDLALLRQTVAALRAAGPETLTPLPGFDKLADERAPVSCWRSFRGRPAAIVIEGWLMGVEPDLASAGAPPLNAVERSDEAGTWRRHQERALAEVYASLWNEADGFLHITPPGFGCVLDWRLQQEAGLWEAKGEPMPDARRAWVHAFIQHYERLTRRMIAGGHRPGATIRIDAGRRVLETSGL